MASAASHESSSRHEPLLSPPSSPQSTRHRIKRKKTDPFEELALTPVPSRPSSPVTLPEEDKDESWFAKIILTPLIFVSFIVSLFLVNHRNRVRRKKAHTASSSSIFSYVVPLSWLNSEPYQDPDDSTWSCEGPFGHIEPHDSIARRRDASSEGHRRKKSWHLNKKIRKVAKLEIGDAFEMRGRIMIMMLIAMVLGSAAMWITMKWMFASLTKIIAYRRS